MLCLFIALACATSSLDVVEDDEYQINLANCYADVPESADGCMTVAYDYGCHYAINFECLRARRCQKLVDDLNDECAIALPYANGSCRVTRDIECVKARQAPISTAWHLMRLFAFFFSSSDE